MQAFKCCMYHACGVRMLHLTVDAIEGAGARDGMWSSDTYCLFASPFKKFGDLAAETEIYNPAVLRMLRPGCSGLCSGRALAGVHIIGMVCIGCSFVALGG